jgi:hypothetical protein
MLGIKVKFAHIIRLIIADKIDSMNRMKLHRLVEMFWKRVKYFSRNLRNRLKPLL